MIEVEHQKNLKNVNLKIYTKRQIEIMDALEAMLQKGVPDLTMSEFAKKLKISLRTLYEIAPSKDKLILMTMNNILVKLGKLAIDSVANINSPEAFLWRRLTTGGQYINLNRHSA